MSSISTNSVTLVALAHILDRMKKIESRLIEIEDCVVEDRVSEIEVADDEAAAYADQLLDAADDIEDGEIVPGAAGIAERLRQIAAQLSEESS